MRHPLRCRPRPLPSAKRHIRRYPWPLWKRRSVLPGQRQARGAARGRHHAQRQRIQVVAVGQVVHARFHGQLVVEAPAGKQVDQGGRPVQLLDRRQADVPFLVQLADRAGGVHHAGAEGQALVEQARPQGQVDHVARRVLRVGVGAFEAAIDAVRRAGQLRVLALFAIGAALGGDIRRTGLGLEVVVRGQIGKQLAAVIAGLELHARHLEPVDVADQAGRQCAVIAGDQVVDAGIEVGQLQRQAVAGVHPPAWQR
ncbi:hypothetical protein G6F68_012786 [Rhizopus microsporus]|nr:hypothetical protein G6F68_012786 [Rhizopus microsporus]